MSSVANSSNRANESEELYPAIDPYDSGRMALDSVHEMYWEQCGNPTGEPVVFLHGGPGVGASPKDRRFFDPNHFRVVLFDQRGAGRSTPLGELTDNTIDHLVDDIERLRESLGIDRWHVFGGSWGSTLALYYAQCHPSRCRSLVLRGIFAMRQWEIDWWLNDMGRIFPEAWREFVEHLPENERNDLLENYYWRLTSEDFEEQLAAAKVWSRYEGVCCTLLPNPQFQAAFERPEVALGVARLEAHYFRNNRFTPDDLLLQQVDKIRHIPAIIVQGRYDIVCPIATADELHRRWPEAHYVIVPDAGHSSREPGICRELVGAMNRLRDGLPL